MSVELVRSRKEVEYESKFSLDPKTDLLMVLDEKRNARISVRLEIRSPQGYYKYIKEIRLSVNYDDADSDTYVLKGEFPLEILPRLIGVLEEIFRREYADEFPNEEGER